MRSLMRGHHKAGDPRMSMTQSRPKQGSQWCHSKSKDKGLRNWEATGISLEIWRLEKGVLVRRDTKQCFHFLYFLFCFLIQGLIMQSILLSLPANYWDYRCGPPCQLIYVYVLFGAQADWVVPAQVGVWVFPLSPLIHMPMSSRNTHTDTSRSNALPVF
jgi:hypothetical protein